MRESAGENRPARWLVARAWLAGALKALAIIAFWALIIWAGVSAFRAMGLLPLGDR